MIKLIDALIKMNLMDGIYLGDLERFIALDLHLIAL